MSLQGRIALIIRTTLCVVALTTIAPTSPLCQQQGTLMSDPVSAPRPWLSNPRTIIEDDLRARGFGDWRFRLSTSESLSLPNAEDRHRGELVLCEATFFGPPLPEGFGMPNVTSGETSWRAVVNLSTRDVYWIFGRTADDTQKLLTQEVGRVQSAAGAVSIGRFYGWYCYAGRVEEIRSEWDAYSFAVENLALWRGMADRWRALRVMKSGFWGRLGVSSEITVVRDDLARKWRVRLMVGKRADEPGISRVEYHELSLVVGEDASFEVERDERVAQVESNFEANRVYFRICRGGDCRTVWRISMP